MTGIDLGEAQVIMLAKQKEERKVLIDQSEVRKIAKYLGLNPQGTIFVIITATKKNLITKEDAKEILVKLIDTNFYLSAKVYHEALITIEKL
jgi:predicted nucleic acid-binding protein